MGRKIIPASEVMPEDEPEVIPADQVAQAYSSAYVPPRPSAADVAMSQVGTPEAPAQRSTEDRVNQAIGEDPEGVGKPAAAEKLTKDPNKASILETILLHGAQGVTGRNAAELAGGMAAAPLS